MEEAFLPLQPWPLTNKSCGGCGGAEGRSVHQSLSQPGLHVYVYTSLPRSIIHGRGLRSYEAGLSEDG